MIFIIAESFKVPVGRARVLHHDPRDRDGLASPNYPNPPCLCLTPGAAGGLRE